VGLVARVCDAVQHAHDQGVIHRDLKPANILVEDTGQPKVLDFGVARATGADLLTAVGLTQTGQLLGTPNYMSPEQVAADPAAIDRRADVYALGVILFELLAHRLPYRLEDRPLAEAARLIVEQDPPLLGSLDPELRGDVETIVAKALEKDPARRYPSAADLGADLRRWLAHEPILARRVSGAERVSRWCKRNPVMAGLLAAVFLLLAAVAGVASVGYVQTKGALSGEAKHRIAAEEAEGKATREADRARMAEQEIRRQWYAASSNLMQPAWDTGQVGRLHALLAETEAYPDRGFEWYYWERLCHLDQHTLIGHRSELLSVSWSPDGTRLATGSYDGTAKVWDAAGGRVLLTLRGHRGLVYCVSWSPDGMRLATGSQDNTAKVWDAADGQVLHTLERHTNSVTSVYWSPDGTRLATGSGDNTAKIWDASGRRMLHNLEGHASAVRSLSWSPDGARLATGSYDGTVKVWDAAGGRELFPLRGHAGLVYSVTWSPDGTRLATGGEDGTAKVWDAAGGRELFPLRGHAGLVYEVSWSPEGTRLATGSSDGLAKMWDAAGGREIRTLKGHISQVRSVSWSPDGTQLATGSGDGTAKVWGAAGGREWLTLEGHTGPVGSVSWSPDGTRLATGSGDNTAKVWDAAGGGKTCDLKGHTGLVGSVSWSPDGTRLATASADRTAKVWDAADGQEIRTLKGHNSPVRSVSWSPDGTRLATGSLDGTAKVWDAADEREPLDLEGHTGTVSSVSWSPDGTRLATGSYDGTARVWDAVSGRVLLTLEGHTGLVYSVSWSRDGSRLATGSTDGTARTWDATSGQELLMLKGHISQVRSVSWSPDGTRLATGNLDGTAKVWDVAGGRELLTLKGHAGEVIVSWSPDGTRLATGSYDGTAKVWDAAGAAAVRQWARQDRDVQDLLDSYDFRGPHAQGFFQTWLLLLPLPFASGETSLQALDRPQLPGEASLRPRPGERVTVGGQPCVWQEYRSPKAIVDFNAVLGRVKERCVAYAVCYIESDQARDGLWLQLGSDDQAKVHLNGREIYRIRQPRTMWTLDTVGPMGLKRGINVLLFKVVNETGQWESCARLVDEAYRPVQGLRVMPTP
jgi:WD40 repeat protein